MKAIVETWRCISFFEKVEDRENHNILWSCYGDPDTNQLILKLEKGDKVFYNAVQSPLVVPLMKDRIWGMDMSDEEATRKLSEWMWKKYKKHLKD